MKKIIVLLLLLSTVFGAAIEISQSQTKVYDVYVPATPTTYPSQLRKGMNNILVEVPLTNYAKTTLYNLSTELRTTHPFIGVKTKDFITRIDPNERASVFYRINIADDAQQGEYQLLHKITYYDASGNKQETSKTMIFRISYVKRIEVSKIDAIEALPGQTVPIKITFENTGDLLVDDISVTLTPSSTASGNIEFVPTMKRIEIIPIGENKTIEFEMTASKFASAGSYPVTISATYGDNTLEQTFIATVAGKPILDVKDMHFSDTPMPDSTITLHVDITNPGGAKITGVTAKLSSSTSGIAVVSDSQLYIDEILPKEKTSLEYTINIHKSEPSGVYALTLEFTSSEISQTQTISFEVRGKPKLQLAGVQTDKDVVYTGSPFSLSIQFENIGTGDAKSVKVVLDDNDIEGVLTSFVGTIEVDDTGTAIFDIIDKKPGRRIVKATVTYEDEYGNPAKKEVNIEYYVTSKPINIVGIIVVVAVLGGIGYYLYRKKQKEKRLKQLVK